MPRTIRYDSWVTTELTPASDAFPTHMFDALGVPPLPFEERIGGSVMVVEKRPDNGPVTIMTSGASRLPIDSGLPVELAVEVLDGQQGAAFVALRIVSDDMAQNRRVPPVGSPWRNDEPFLNGTGISAIVAIGSRWGRAFDDVVGSDGSTIGHVRTLRLLTDAEAVRVAAIGWDAFVTEIGTPDALLDVTRQSLIGPAKAAVDAHQRRPVFITKMHEEHPPRWVTLQDGAYQSVTGLESDEYMNEAGNHEIWSTDSFIARFPWTERFLLEAHPDQTALFTSADGTYVLEE